MNHPDTDAFSFNSIVHWFAQELGVKLKEFIMYDPNTFYLINGHRQRTYTVQTNPDVLNYNVSKSEKGKTAEKLLQQALQKVCKTEERLISRILKVVHTGSSSSVEQQPIIPRKSEPSLLWTSLVFKLLPSK